MLVLLLGHDEHDAAEAAEYVLAKHPGEQSDQHHTSPCTTVSHQRHPFGKTSLTNVPTQGTPPAL